MTRLSRRSFLIGATLTTLAGLMTSGCGSRTTAAAEARSSRPRQTQPNVAQPDIIAQADSNNAFAFSLYQTLRSGETNLFFSPYSITQVLTMALAGARGQTAQQMSSALHVSLPPERLHPAANALNLALTGSAAGQGQEEGNFQLVAANEVWGQTGYAFQQPFLDLLAENYGAGMRLLDFRNAPEQARTTINTRISEQTRGKITDLLPPGSIEALTRLVLTNAIYFNAKWQSPFTREATRDGDFTPLSGGAVTTPMMTQQAQFKYADGDGYQAIELPYKGSVSMVVVLPATGRFAEVEGSLEAARLTAMLGGLQEQQVQLTMPKFNYRAKSFSLKQSLTQLGMTDAFQPQVADFSGMDGTRELYISDGFHEATVTVDEAGTEAAAATAAVIGVTSAPIQPPAQMIINRPFIFLIRHNDSGAMLFLGRILNPR